MYKLVLSDLDETLIVNHRVPAFNQEAIKRVREKDVKFVVCTGRSQMMIDDILRDLSTYDCENEYSICFNGGLVMENKNKKILHFTSLDYEKAKIIHHEGIKRGLCIILFTIDHCFLIHPIESEVQRKIAQKADFTIIEDDDFTRFKNKKIAKILLVKEDMNYLKQLREEVRPLVKGVELSFSSNRYMECTSEGVNKGEGLKWLAHYLHIDIRQTIAIGDNYNDVSMLECAGIGACVSSSNDDIKEISDYVCRHDYDEGAVKEVLEKFI